MHAADSTVGSSELIEGPSRAKLRRGSTGQGAIAEISETGWNFASRNDFAMLVSIAQTLSVGRQNVVGYCVTLGDRAKAILDCL